MLTSTPLFCVLRGSATERPHADTRRQGWGAGAHRGTMAERIEFWATVAQVKTMSDGGLRVALDLPEHAVAQAAMLIQCKAAGAVLDVTVTPRVEECGGATGATPRRRAGKQRIPAGSPGV